VPVVIVRDRSGAEIGDRIAGILYPAQATGIAESACVALGGRYDLAEAACETED